MELEEVMKDLLERGSPNWTYAAAARFVPNHLHRDLKWYFHTDGSLRRWGESGDRAPTHGVAGAGWNARPDSVELGLERVEVDEAESDEPQVEDVESEDTGFRYAEPENAEAEPAEPDDPRPEDLIPEDSSPQQIEGAQISILSSSLAEIVAAFHRHLAEARASASSWVDPAWGSERGGDNSSPDMDDWVVTDGEDTVWNIVAAMPTRRASGATTAPITEDAILEERDTTLSVAAAEDDIVCPICLEPFDDAATFRGLEMCRRCADSLR